MHKYPMVRTTKHLKVTIPFGKMVIVTPDILTLQRNWLLKVGFLKTCPFGTIWWKES